MNKRVVATSVLAAALVLGGSGAAMAAEYPSAVSSNSVAPGGVVTFTADSGEAAGTPVSISLDGLLALEEGDITTASVLTATSTVAAGGAINFGVTLPTSVPAGTTYTLAVAADDGVGVAFSTTESLAVAALPADAADGDELASTGFDATPYVWFGGGLLLLGAGLVSVLAFVRRSNNAAA